MEKRIVTRSILLLAVSAITLFLNACAPAPPSDLQTEFIEDAKLSPKEVEQVVELGRESGVPDVGLIRTFYYTPGHTRGVEVRSKERVNGRNISYDSVYVSHEGWGEALPRPEAKRVGPFWVNKPHLETTLKREFTFDGKPVRVLIEPTVDAAFADQVIPLVVGRRVRFENDAVRREFERLDLSKPASIGKSFSNNG